MLPKPLVFLSALLSFHAVADVGFEEKQYRVSYLEEIAKKAPGMDIDVFRRELQYEKQNLTVEERAQSEAQLLAEQIKLQISRAFEAASEAKSREEALTEIREAIERDALLLAPELRDEIVQLSLDALDDIVKGKISTSDDLSALKTELLSGAQDRHRFLNEEGLNFVPLPDMLIPSLGSPNKPIDADKREYKTKAELLGSLASDRESTPWISTAGTTLKSAVASKTEKSISLQVKADYLGISVSAGPSFVFSREYLTDVQVLAEGMAPILLADGNFDLYKRDRAGKVILKNGNPVRRFMSFYCDATLKFETETRFGGGFTLVGTGANATASTKYSSEVNLASRRILIPDIVAGKTVTYKMLNELCLNDFLRSPISGKTTVADSLNIMMKNIVAGLRFSHPKTKCATDEHCYKWFNTELVSIMRAGKTPRCVNNAQNFSTCELRGLDGSNCTVYDTTGKRVSDGMFEFKCDKGYQCVKYQDEGWFSNWQLYQYARGKCLPVRK